METRETRFKLSLAAQRALSDESAERSLTIVTAPVVGVVGEKKAIYCKGDNVNSSDMEWLDPKGKAVPLRSGKNNRVYVENYKSKGLMVLIIFSLMQEDTGNWTCRTKNEDQEELSQTISIFAGIRAEFSGDDEKKVEEGNAVKLTCKAKGHPTPQVYWTSDNYPKTIESDNHMEIRKDDTKGIYTLLIKRATYQDAGIYYCKLYQDILKHHAIKKITVEVIHKPIMFDAETNLTIEEPPKGSTTASVKEVFVVLNEPKTLRCAAVGNPKPQFFWYYKDENEYFKEIKDEYLMTHDDYSSNLTFTLTEDSPPTMFKCLAKNDKGRTMLVYDIHIGNRPVKPDDIKFVSANTSFINFEVTCSNCTFETTDPDHLAVIGYGFQLVPYKEGYPPDWQNCTYIKVPIENENVTTFSVGPLEKGTTYQVRVSSYNQATDSEWLEMGATWLELTKTDHAPRLVSTVLVLATSLFLTMCF
ncbi:immunoglobulin i-set domain-containing protein [Phthorimaea operculella]|nr:immunoglobulin i-set domain-containing protein [Phthorimaea operculella]